MAWDLALRLEHQVAQIITQQEINGWEFDLPKANRHNEFLLDSLSDLYTEARPLLRSELEVHKEILAPYKKDGKLSTRAVNRLGEQAALCGGPFTPVTWSDPDLGSRQKVMKQLLAFGWKPDSFTEKGNPQLDEDSLVGLDHPVGKLIAEWYVLRHRQGQLAGWLDKVRPDGRIAAEAVPCGTPTGRMRHRVVVNVPTANVEKGTGRLLYYPEGEVKFGTEMREVFIARPGFKLVGYDAKGLELRIMAHFMQDDEFTEAVLNGDPHQNNADKMGVTKKVSKPAMYACTYGAGDGKLGAIVGGGALEGAIVREKLMEAMPGLRRLTEQVQQASKRGYLYGLDGRKMPVRSEHSALNTLIQGGGAVFMKYVMCILDDMIRENPFLLYNYYKVGDFHDESQQEIRDNEKYIELFSDLVVKSFSRAEADLGIRVPMGADIKVGANWAETH